MLQMLRDKKKRVFFVTNNSASLPRAASSTALLSWILTACSGTSSRAMYQAKFAKLGIPCETKDIFPSVGVVVWLCHILL